jgi:hypothetical protein
LISKSNNDSRFAVDADDALLDHEHGRSLLQAKKGNAFLAPFSNYAI